MKKFCVITLALAVTVIGARFAMAHQNSSFTYIATAGIFEDQYDQFKYSPSYLPGFQKNTFWGQLANLQSQKDLLFGDQSLKQIVGLLEDFSVISSTTADTIAGLGVTTNNYYLAGTQFDAGLGRAGVMIDWLSATTPQSNNAPYHGSGLPVGTTSHSGFGEFTNDSYIYDTATGDLQSRRETYGRSDNTDNSVSSDIYAAYGLGGIAGLDLGAALRAVLSSSAPTYNDYDSAHSVNTSFNLLGSDRQYDLIAGREIVREDVSGTGSLTFGASDMRLILGARSKGLMPNLDLIVNAAPVLLTYSNALSWTYTDTKVNNPSDPASISDLTTTYEHKGIEDGGNLSLPGSGMGVAAGVRGDYTLNQNVIVTGSFNMEMTGWKSADAKNESTDTTLQRDTYFSGPNQFLQTDKTTAVTTYTWDQTSGTTSMMARVRAQFLNQGWKWGLGVNAGTANVNRDRTENLTSNSTHRFDTGNSSTPASNYTAVASSGSKSQTKTETITDVLELPMGMVIDLMKNLNLQLGASHVITLVSSTSSTKPLETNLSKTTTTTDAGVTTVTYGGSATPSTSASETSTYRVSHVNNFTYGLTWWPYENLQIDVTGFGNLFDSLSLFTYRVSASIYF